MRRGQLRGPLGDPGCAESLADDEIRCCKGKEKGKLGYATRTVKVHRDSMPMSQCFMTLCSPCLASSACPGSVAETKCVSHLWMEAQSKRRQRKQIGVCRVEVGQYWYTYIENRKLPYPCDCHSPHRSDHYPSCLLRLQKRLLLSSNALHKVIPARALVGNNTLEGAIGVKDDAVRARAAASVGLFAGQDGELVIGR